MTLNIALIGCGGMGLRHAYGYAELRRHFNSVRIAAVCDLHESSASYVASEIGMLTGEKPKVYVDLERMFDEQKELDAVDIVTDTRSHHTIAMAAFAAGLDVLVEKPMAVTVRACLAMTDASRRHGRTLSVAENYRRDPMNRLARALLRAGAVGTPQFMLKMSMTGGHSMACNVGWHGRKDYAGGILIELGVHEADLLLYFMGNVSSVSAETALFTPDRQFSERQDETTRFYKHRVEHVRSNRPAFTLEQDDTAFAVIRFESGAIAQYTLTNASHGYGMSLDTVHGSEGTMFLPRSRSGQGLSLSLESGDRRIEGPNLFSFVPGWELDDITCRVWDGQSRISSYELPFEEADRKLIAIELQEFADAISKGKKPEVDEDAGARAVALAYAPLESSTWHGPVRMADVMSGAVSAYQDSIDRGLGL